MTFINTDTMSFDAATNSFTFSMPENIEAGTVISDIEHSYAGTITDMVVDGDDWLKFEMRETAPGKWALVYIGAGGVNFEDTATTDFDLSIDILIEDDDGDVIFDEVGMTAAINVADVNEQPEDLKVNLNTDLAQVDGNAALCEEDTDTSSRTKIADLVVKDPDTSAEFQATDFTLNGDHGDMFEIDDGVLYLRAGVTLDHETQPELNISIKYAGIGAEGDPPVEKAVTVIITDYDEPAGIEAGVPETAYVDENVAAGKVLATLCAIDPEGDTVRYYLDREAENSEMFQIRSSTGELTLRPGYELDFEAQESIEITVLLRASEDGNPSHREPATFTLHLNNVVETGPAEIIQLGEASSGAVIGKVSLDGANAVTEAGSTDASSNFVIEDGLLKVSAANVAAGIYELTLSGPDGSSQNVTIRVNVIRPPEFEGTTNSSKSFEYYIPDDVVDEDGDKLEFMDTTAPVATATGSYTVTDGVLEWTPGGSLVKAAYDEVFEVDILDSSGGRGKATVTVTVEPTIVVSGVMEAWEDSVWNDPAGHLISEDARDIHTLTLTVNGTVVAQDQTVITAQYGTLTVDQNGYWAYALDNSNADVEALDGDDDDTDGAVGTLTETITVVYANAGGETETRSFEITIHGRTDVYFTDDGQSSSSNVFKGTYNGIPYVSYSTPYSSLYEDISVHGTNVDAEFDAFTLHGSDIIHGNDENNIIYSRRAFDVIHGYGGDDRLGSTGGSDIIYGGEGTDLSLYLNRYISDVEVDLGSDIRWKYNRATGEWESGTGDGYEFIRATYLHEYDDPDGAGTVSIREYDYLNSIEGIETNSNGRVRGVVSENRLYGNDEDNYFYSRDGNHIIDGRGGDDAIRTVSGVDILTGGSGDDLILAGADDDVLTGGSGRDTLAGEAGADTFVLYQDSAPIDGTDLDIVADFTFGEDLIRVDTADGDETTLADLQANAQIRWEQRHVETEPITNDAAVLDTVIYNIGEDRSPGTDDDIMLMVLEDVTDELTLAQFDIV